MVHSEIYSLNHSGAGEDYETARLDFQHALFVRLTKGNLLPEHIFRNLPPNARIADVGTGTGIWLNELSKQLPFAQLEGFDMAPENFGIVASNVKLHEYSQNALEAFQYELQGKFDVVHVRLLMFGLKSNEWAKAFANLATLLKPGGWVCWEDTGYISWVTIPPSRAWYDLLNFDIEFARMVGRDIT